MEMQKLCELDACVCTDFNPLRVKNIPMWNSCHYPH